MLLACFVLLGYPWVTQPSATPANFFIVSVTLHRQDPDTSGARLRQGCPGGVSTNVYSLSSRSPPASWPMSFTRFTHAGSTRTRSIRSRRTISCVEALIRRSTPRCAATRSSAGVMVHWTLPSGTSRYSRGRPDRASEVRITERTHVHSAEYTFAVHSEV